MRRMGAAIFAIGAMSAGLGACASEPANAPAWYTQRVREMPHSYPSLTETPPLQNAETSQAHWDAVIADVTAARDAMQADPRNQPATGDNAQGFVDQARQDIEQTRASH